MRQDKKNETKQIDRRRLLKGAGLAVGAAGAASTAAAAGATDGAAESKPQQAGYRETEAVKTYYRVARF
jgi:hypothetical protein